MAVVRLCIPGIVWHALAGVHQERRGGDTQGVIGTNAAVRRMGIQLAFIKVDTSIREIRVREGSGWARGANSALCRVPYTARVLVTLELGAYLRRRGYHRGLL